MSSGSMPDLTNLDDTTQTSLAVRLASALAERRVAEARSTIQSSICSSDGFEDEPAPALPPRNSSAEIINNDPYAHELVGDPDASRELESLSSTLSDLAVSRSCGKAVALYDFTPEAPTELALLQGQVVVLTSCDEGAEWWVGRLSDGTEGAFPKSYVMKMNDEPPSPVAEYYEGGYEEGYDAYDVPSVDSYAESYAAHSTAAAETPAPAGRVEFSQRPPSPTFQRRPAPPPAPTRPHLGESPASSPSAHHRLPSSHPKLTKKTASKTGFKFLKKGAKIAYQHREEIYTGTTKAAQAISKE